MKKLVINENWHINSDSEGSTLIFSEVRERKDGKSKGEQYLYEEPYYYSNVGQCLKAFLNKSMEDAADVKEAIAIVESTYEKISKLKFDSCR